MLNQVPRFLANANAPQTNAADTSGHNKLGNNPLCLKLLAQSERQVMDSHCKSHKI